MMVIFYILYKKRKDVDDMKKLTYLHQFFTYNT